jgi:hypothetical protein
MDNGQTITLNTADKTILLHLYRTYGNPQSLFQLHKEYAFSPAQLGSFVRKLGEIGIVELQDDYILLTECGKNWLLSNRNKIFFSQVQYNWQEIPKEMQEIKIDIDSLYLPKVRKLGKHFLEDLSD